MKWYWKKWNNKLQEHESCARCVDPSWTEGPNRKPMSSENSWLVHSKAVLWLAQISRQIRLRNKKPWLQNSPSDSISKGQLTAKLHWAPKKTVYPTQVIQNSFVPQPCPADHHPKGKLILVGWRGEGGSFRSITMNLKNIPTLCVFRAHVFESIFMPSLTYSLLLGYRYGVCLGNLSSSLHLWHTAPLLGPRMCHLTGRM